MIEITRTPRRYAAEVELNRKPSYKCDEVLTMEDVCSWLGVCERTILRYIEENGFPCKKVGKTRLFGKRSIIEWVNSPD